jgi:5-methylcytosine-specific restriction endonuclease McrA
MPIRPELRHFYGREWRTLIRPRILKRDNHRCAQCGVANYEVGIRDGPFFQPVPVRRRRGRKLTRIVLTIAHLNHIAGDDRDDNLKALCQRCHFLHDLEQHHVSRSTRKDLARPLLAKGETA